MYFVGMSYIVFFLLLIFFFVYIIILTFKVDLSRAINWSAHSAAGIKASLAVIFDTLFRNS